MYYNHSVRVTKVTIHIHVHALCVIDAFYLYYVTAKAVVISIYNTQHGLFAKKNSNFNSENVRF